MARYTHFSTFCSSTVCKSAVLAGSLFLMFQASALFAQVSTPVPVATAASKIREVPPTPAPPTPTPFPQKGVLSRAATKNYNTKIVDGPWAGGGDSQGGAPIAGSVSRKSDREWVAKLYNNSEDAYSVSVEVIQMNKSGKREKSDSFATRLSAKGSYERVLRATDRTVDCQLNLVNWKNLTAKKALKEESDSSLEAGAGVTAQPPAAINR